MEVQDFVARHKIDQPTGDALLGTARDLRASLG